MTRSRSLERVDEVMGTNLFVLKGFPKDFVKEKGIKIKPLKTTCKFCLEVLKTRVVEGPKVRPEDLRLPKHVKRIGQELGSTLSLRTLVEKFLVSTDL